MKQELFEALDMLENERGISVDFMLEKIEKAIIKACKNNYNGNDDAVVNIDRENNIFDVYIRKTVVEKVENAGREISFKDAKKLKSEVELGDIIEIKLDTKQFGRIAAQTARNIIRQGIRDGERTLMLQEFQDRLNKISSALVEKIDSQSGAVSLRIGKAEAVLPRSECTGIEGLKEGDHIKVLIVDIRETEKGPKAILSRNSGKFVEKLFENEVPEISQGIIEIKAISREAGQRTKIAVASNDEKIDPVGSCIGAKGSRISTVIEELNGEKIDVVPYSEDIASFIAAALSPAEVLGVNILEDQEKACEVFVNPKKLSLAIGNKGQNARLAAKLTGWKIDIKPKEEND